MHFLLWIYEFCGFEVLILVEDVANGGRLVILSCYCWEFRFLIEVEDDSMSAVEFIDLHFGDFSDFLFFRFSILFFFFFDS